MTEQEKREIIDELENRMEQKYKGFLTKEDTQSVLKMYEQNGSHNQITLILQCLEFLVVSSTGRFGS